MIKLIILVLIGFYFLIKGSDIFVDGISSTATNLKISKIIISLTIVAFGTSTPELFISFQSLLSGNNDVVIANVVGSTIVNTLLVIGTAALIRPIRIKNETIRRQLPLHLIIISSFGILLLDELFTHSINTISRSDAIVLLIIFLGFIYYIYKFQQKRNPIKELFREKPKWNLPKSIIIGLFGLAAIAIGSDIAVDNCVNIANYLHVSQKIITMVILVIGTSTPELIMAITAVKKDEHDIIIGNIIGTNIFNIGFVLTLPIIIFGSVTTTAFHFPDMFIMTIAGFILYLFASDDRKLDKAEGTIMLTIFLIYYVYILFVQQKRPVREIFKYYLDNIETDFFQNFFSFLFGVSDNGKGIKQHLIAYFYIPINEVFF